jgi:hypothetical protein
MVTMAIGFGARVEVTTALGEHVQMRALGGPEKGHDFDVIWVTTEAEYEAAKESGAEPDGIPWPVESVRVLDLA